MRTVKFLPVNDGEGGRDKNLYCGPSAMSIVTGMTTGEAARLLRSISGDRATRGVIPGALITALRQCGVETRKLPLRDLRRELEDAGRKSWLRPTLAAWLRWSRRDRTFGRVFLVDAGDHFQVVSGRRFCDSITREVVSVRDKRIGRWRSISRVWELSVRDGERITVPEAARKPRPEYGLDRNEVRRILRRYPDIGVERDDRCTWVTSPAGIVDTDRDPHCGDHSVGHTRTNGTYWPEVLTMVQEIVVVIEEAAHEAGG